MLFKAKFRIALSSGRTNQRHERQADPECDPCRHLKGKILAADFVVEHNQPSSRTQLYKPLLTWTLYMVDAEHGRLDLVYTSDSLPSETLIVFDQFPGLYLRISLTRLDTRGGDCGHAALLRDRLRTSNFMPLDILQTVVPATDHSRTSVLTHLNGTILNVFDGL